MGIQNRGLQRRFMGDKNVVCVAVSDCDTTRRNAARDSANKRYDNKDCKDYVDFRELIARDEIYAVSIATPDHWHAIQTINDLTIANERLKMAFSIASRATVDNHVETTVEWLTK